MSGNFYQRLCEKRAIGNRPDSDELKKCVYKTVDELAKENTTVNKPGMLLGKVQSGKTNAYLGIIALSFDRGYDIAIILQKGTKALSAQKQAPTLRESMKSLNL